MEPLTHILQDEQVIALLIGTLIFFITLFFVARRKTSFSKILIPLLFLLLVGFVVNNQSVDQIHMSQPAELPEEQEVFNKQIQNAYENIQSEVTTERENILNLVNQVMQVFDQVEEQKEKLEHFIEETGSLKTQESIL